MRPTADVACFASDDYKSTADEDWLQRDQAPRHSDCWSAQPAAAADTRTGQTSSLPAGRTMHRASRERPRLPNAACGHATVAGSWDRLSGLFDVRSNWDPRAKIADTLPRGPSSGEWP